MVTLWGTLFQAFLPVLTFKESVVKIFHQPPQDPEMVEGSDVDEYHDAASDLSICESSKRGEIEAHRGSTHDTEEDDKSKLHLDTDGEAPEEGHDTGKEIKVKRFQQRLQDSETVEGSDIADYHNAAPDHFIPESSESGEIEAHRSPTHNIEQEDKSKPHPDTEAGAQQEVHGILTTIRDSLPVIEQNLAPHPMPLNNSRREKKRGSSTEGVEQKKRQRCKNWADDETEQLVNLRLERNLGKNKSNELLWEAISKQIPDRTPKQCQNRWDTVVRYYNTIKFHLDDQNKRSSDVTRENFQEMKVGSYFWKDERRYEMFGTRTSSSNQSEPTVAAHELSGKGSER